MVWFQANGWMDAELMIKYIDYFNNNRSEASTMLVYDSFRRHLEKSVKKKFHDNNVDLVVISGDLTSVCLVLGSGSNQFINPSDYPIQNSIWIIR